MNSYIDSVMWFFGYTKRQAKGYILTALNKDLIMIRREYENRNGGGE